MKAHIFLAFVIVIFTSCKKDDNNFPKTDVLLGDYSSNNSYVLRLAQSNPVLDTNALSDFTVTKPGNDFKIVKDPNDRSGYLIKIPGNTNDAGRKLTNIIVTNTEIQFTLQSEMIMSSVIYKGITYKLHIASSQSIIAAYSISTKKIHIKFVNTCSMAKMNEPTIYNVPCELHMSCEKMDMPM